MARSLRARPSQLFSSYLVRVKLPATRFTWAPSRRMPWRPPWKDLSFFAYERLVRMLSWSRNFACSSWGWSLCARTPLFFQSHLCRGSWRRQSFTRDRRQWRSYLSSTTSSFPLLVRYWSSTRLTHHHSIVRSTFLNARTSFGGSQRCQLRIGFGTQIQYCRRLPSWSLNTQIYGIFLDLSLPLHTLPFY